MAATAINGIIHSKSGAKAGLVVDGGFAASWRGRRLVQSAAKPNMRRKTYLPVYLIEGMAIIKQSRIIRLLP